MINIGLLAYGETAQYALKSLLRKFKVDWIIIPPKNSNNPHKPFPVEILANKTDIKVIRTNTEEDILKAIKETRPSVVVISSYNEILSHKILTFSKFINVHHGNLPQYKGRANINWAIINGKKKIGLIIHETIPQLDSGNIYAQYSIPITEEDTVRTVYDKFNRIIEKNLATVVQKVINGYKGQPQKGISTYCCGRLPEDGYIDWSWTSQRIYNFIRALTKPYPGAFTYLDDKKIIIWEAEIPGKPRVYEGRIPGRISMIHKDYGVEVLTGDSSIIIKNINFKGKDINASKLIKLVKKTLGINLVLLYEQIISLKKLIKTL